MELHEPAVAYSKQKMTIEEYLAFENGAGTKHEYYQGEVFAMGGAKLAHNRIVKNTFGEIFSFLHGKTCEPFGSDLRIFVEQKQLFTYPDISIFCEGVTTLNNDQMNAVNPTALIEVLSPGTKEYDLGLKFTLYKAINSLREYIVTDSETINCKVFVIDQQGEWQLKEYKHIGETIWMHSIQLEIPLQTIYAGTDLR